MASIGNIQNYWIIPIFLWLISILLLNLLKKITQPTLHLPPSPPGLPFIGHLHFLSPVVTKCFSFLSSKYGPLLYLRFGSRPAILVSSASFATEIFKRNDVIFSNRPKTPFDDRLIFGEYGILNCPYGDYWRSMRKLCVTELLGIRQVERFIDVRNEEIQKRFLKKLLEKAHRNENLDLGKELMKLTNNIICRMVMGTRCSEEDDEAERCRELVHGAFDLAGKLAVATMLGPLKKLGFWLNRKELNVITRKCDELLDKILEEHEDRAKRNNGDDKEVKDLLDILLQVCQDKDTKFKISKNHIKAFIMDLFVGGTDTSAATMQWIMAELSNHPKIFKKLRDEIKSVIGTNRLVQESDIPNLHYLQAVVTETLRLSPQAPIIPRECREDCEIGGFDIPKDAAVLINAYSIMRDPEIWENPNKFYPERFLQEKEIKMQNKLNFLSFGAGRRSCPGSHLASSVIHITIGSMVQCFDWKFVGDGNGGNKANMEAKAGMTFGLAHPLLCVPVLHFNPFLS
ncbi:hypothetical protein JCGZ_16726 [Jatropha curcas]|uniref:Cytochrome P450 n=1 Tax=Jatropha curcas TaxID=180498 RepID=A0A067LGX3_JATCU|nr:hypothetical protein JCGZ_16726 [Jatropha curcas]